jgi:hypothetical protein
MSDIVTPKPIFPRSKGQIIHTHTPETWRNRRALSLKETAASLGISSAHLHVLIKGGKLKTVKLGGRTIVTPEAIEALLNGGAC